MDWSDSPFGDFMVIGQRTGLAEIREAFREWYAAWENVETEVEELFAAGDHVISVFTYRGRGRTSGAEVEWKHMAGLWSFRDGRIAEVAWLHSREAALARAAG
jgi:ketosteroid isomerase-like protein